MLGRKKATIVMGVGGAQIEVADVNAAEVFLVLVELLESFKILQKQYPELLSTSVLESVGQYSPLHILEDFGGERKSCGFKAKE